MFDSGFVNDWCSLSGHLQPGCQRWTADKRCEWGLLHSAAPPVMEERSRAAAWFDATRRPAVWALPRPAATLISGEFGDETCFFLFIFFIFVKLGCFWNAFETVLWHGLRCTTSDIWEMCCMSSVPLWDFMEAANVRCDVPAPCRCCKRFVCVFWQLWSSFLQRGSVWENHTCWTCWNKLPHMHYAWLYPHLWRSDSLSVLL